MKTYVISQSTTVTIFQDGSAEERSRSIRQDVPGAVYRWNNLRDCPRRWARDLEEGLDPERFLYR